MVVNKGTNPSDRKQDFVNVTILLAIVLGVGIYLIVTTVLIAKDGVFYIRQAQKFSTDPVGIIKGYPFGYPFLIFMAHKFIACFIDSSSVYTWIYSAQVVTLLCRLLALVPLYLIGKFLVGGKESFYALVILIILPYPARFGSDVLRDWPHILFLATGFFFLLWGAKQGKWWMFGIAGLAAGLGHTIRPECAQLVIYGILWFLIGLFLQKRSMGRPRLVCALFILVIGFAIPAVPYMKIRGRVFPQGLKALIGSSCQSQSDRTQKQNANSRDTLYMAANLPGNITKGVGRLIERVSENLMHFFVPALLIGVYCRFRKKSMATGIERFFIPVFIILNVIMLILLYCSSRYISRRHCLPLVVFSIFYVSIGLQVLADWLRTRLFKGRLQASGNPHLLFFVLLSAGVFICLPKLVRPMRMEKQGYRTVADWLKENTEVSDLVAVPDKRISFYAERKELEYQGGKIPATTAYVVKKFKGTEEMQYYERRAQGMVRLQVYNGGRETCIIAIYHFENQS